MQTIYLASGNAHKAEELQAMFAAAGVACELKSARDLGGMPEVDENAETFEGNAEIKARALAELAPADAWILADDSGIEVDALDGAPGVRSARYAGTDATSEDNLSKLMAVMQNVPEGQRGARFVCALVLLAGGEAKLFKATCEGRLDTKICGAGGFGYDPAFIPEGYSESFGVLPAGTKAKLSHRGKAFALLIEYLQS